MAIKDAIQPPIDIWSKDWRPAYLQKEATSDLRSSLVNNFTYFKDPVDLLTEAWTSFKDVTNVDFYKQLGEKIPAILDECCNNQEIKKQIHSNNGMAGVFEKLWVNYDDDAKYLTFGMFFPEESEISVFSINIFKDKHVEFYLRDQNRKVIANQDNINEKQMAQVLEGFDAVLPTLSQPSPYDGNTGL